jgi:hypothetical protein
MVVRDLRGRPAGDVDFLRRELPLVEEDDPVAFQAENPLGVEHRHQ